MTDRVAVITGAGSGIGRASALALCEDGWSVVLVGRRAAMLEETAGLATGGKTLAVPTDVTDPAQVAALFAKAKEKFGRVDMLFNNAGGNVPTTNFGDFTWEQWTSVVAVNLNAMFLCANAAFRMMRLERVGTYAVQPVWADGHATGIYSFDYLRRAAEAGQKR